MFCPLCGKKLVDISRPEGRSEPWMMASMGTSLVCSCGASVLLRYCFTEEKSSADVIAAKPADVVVNCIASHVGHWPEHGLTVTDKTPPIA